MKPFSPMRIPLSVLKWILILHAVFLGFFLLVCLSLNFINPPFTALEIYRQVFYHYRSRPMPFVRLSELPRSAAWMAVAAEDNTFWRHWGIEPYAVAEAARKNRRIGYSMYGGSTINQQLARTLFLWPKKWMVRKYMEAWIALEMNFTMPKKRILELYLNRVEWGKGIYGIDAASRYYYGKSARELDREEVRCLVTVLPNPLRYSPVNAPEIRRFEDRYELLGRGMAASHSAADRQQPMSAAGVSAASNELSVSNASVVPVVPENTLTDATTDLPPVSNLPSTDEEGL
jgi:monofunctional biosynthetic peptidoglycan transglycosylase